MESSLIPNSAPPYIIFASCLAAFLTLLIFTVAVINMIEYFINRLKKDMLENFPLGGLLKERKNLKNLRDRLPSSIFALISYILALMLADVLHIMGEIFNWPLKYLDLIMVFLLFLITVFCIIFYFKFYLLFKNAITFTLFPPSLFSLHAETKDLDKAKPNN